MDLRKLLIFLGFLIIIFTIFCNDVEGMETTIGDTNGGTETKTADTNDGVETTTVVTNDGVETTTADTNDGAETEDNNDEKGTETSESTNTNKVDKKMVCMFTCMENCKNVK
jgi:hypothetical protein